MLRAVDNRTGQRRFLGRDHADREDEHGDRDERDNPGTHSSLPFCHGGQV